MANLEQYPSILPCALLSRPVKSSANADVFTPDTGEDIVRKNSHNVSHSLTYTYTLLEYRQWLSWYTRLLAQGTHWFKQTTPDVRILRYTGTHSVVRHGDKVRVKLNAIEQYTPANTLRTNLVRLSVGMPLLPQSLATSIKPLYAPLQDGILDGYTITYKSNHRSYGAHNKALAPRDYRATTKLAFLVLTADMPSIRDWYQENDGLWHSANIIDNSGTATSRTVRTTGSFTETPVGRLKTKITVSYAIRTSMYEILQTIMAETALGSSLEGAFAGSGILGQPASTTEEVYASPSLTIEVQGNTATITYTQSSEPSMQLLIGTTSGSGNLHSSIINTSAIPVPVILTGLSPGDQIHATLSDTIATINAFGTVVAPTYTSTYGGGDGSADLSFKTTLNAPLDLPVTVVVNKTIGAATTQAKTSIIAVGSLLSNMVFTQPELDTLVGYTLEILVVDPTGYTLVGTSTPPQAIFIVQAAPVAGAAGVLQAAGYQHFYDFVSDSLIADDSIGILDGAYDDANVPANFTAPLLINTDTNAASLHYDTGSNFVELPFPFSTINSMTFAIKAATTGPSNKTLMGDANSSGPQLNIITPAASAAFKNKLQLYNQLTTSGGFQRILSDTGLVDGEVYIVTVQYNGTESSMVLNGVKQAETNPDNLLTRSPTLIGGLGTFDSLFRGDIDFVAASTTSQTDAEIAQLHADLAALLPLPYVSQTLSLAMDSTNVKATFTHSSTMPMVLTAGSSLGASDYHTSNVLAANPLDTERLLTGLPSDGSTLFVRLTDGTTILDEQITLPNVVLPSVVYYDSGTPLVGTFLNIRLDRGTANPSQYTIKVGDSYGATQYANYTDTVTGQADTYNIPGMPTDGRQLFVEITNNDTADVLQRQYPAFTA